MWSSLCGGIQDLLIQPACAICMQPLASLTNAEEPCPKCRQCLGLADIPLQGLDPLPWLAAARYEGRFRQILFKLRRSQEPRLLASLIGALNKTLPTDAVLVPIPSWKRASLANPIPNLMVKALGREHRPLLQRCRAAVGQHHLNRKQRWQNQRDCFYCDRENSIEVRQTRKGVWIVDDILTTGATAYAAYLTLQQSNINVQGVACLARTPKAVRHSRLPAAQTGCDLQFISREGDGPG